LIGFEELVRKGERATVTFYVKPKHGSLEKCKSPKTAVGISLGNGSDERFKADHVPLWHQIFAGRT
jgi:hypothetical protein